MSDTENNSNRRKFLTRSTQILGGIGGVFALIPFLSTMSPSERAKSAGAPIEVDVSSIQPGMYKVFEWRGKPVWVVRRTQEMINQIADRDDKLSDPMSNEEFQPSYAKNKYRSIKPEFLVLVGVCTHLGCSPKYYPETGSVAFDSDWQGGFFCPCHGSKFDMVGRVYAGVPAPTNMDVPPHYFPKDNILVIGLDGVS